ncbi:hypothetical protein JCM10908_004759 [Rhodotorula pacifica]|uniref:uncharacterized protein n=1 Tax=Rhodotorula pacifica TaxID=1495444 RepID=UPI00316DF256
MPDLYDGPYKPRRSTAAEEAAERELAIRSKARLIRRVQKETESNYKPAKRYTLSAIAGIAYKDYALGKSAPTKSRVALDAIAYAARKEHNASSAEQKDEPLPGRTTLPRLADLCIEVLADSYGQPGVFDALDPNRHRAWMPKLLEAIEKTVVNSSLSTSNTATFPFQVWLDVATRLGAAEMPARWKTYRDLVVADTAELEVLKEINADATYHRLLLNRASGVGPSPSPSPPPTFFLAYLDLRSLPTFSDADVYRLRDPLSHLLAVLRLDGTGLTDGGLAWIVRAAKEKPQYQRLEVLSLRGLRKVTDEGVAPLAGLSNLRLLDIRESGCTSGLRKKINTAILTLSNAPNTLSSSTRPTFFRPPRETRSDLDMYRTSEACISPHVEVELFDPANYSPAQMIHLLHRLGSPTTSLAPVNATTKPLGVHLTALARSSTSTSQHDSNHPPRQRTVEELYQAQLAIRSAQTHATHHAAYGGITSTVPISREAVEESGRKEPGERAAAFRVRDDAVMGGGSGLNSEESRGAKAGTLYAIGQRRFYPQGLGGTKWVPHERDPYSDDETEAHAEEVYRAAEAEAIAAQAREEEEGSLFYRHRHAGGVDRRIKVRGERTFTIPPKEEGMLLRLLPYVPPWEEQEQAAQNQAEMNRVIPQRNPGIGGNKKKRHDVPPTPILTKKRRRDDTAGGYSQSQHFDTFSGSTLFGRTTDASSSPSQTLIASKPSSSSSSPSGAQPFSPFSPAPSSTPHGHQSAKKVPTLYTPRSDPKNLVKTGKALLKRSTLAAFRRN